MTFLQRHVLAVLSGWLSVLALAGCNDRPDAVRPPDIDADKAAGELVRQCDQNGDLQLSAEEAASFPSIHGNLAAIDTDKNGQLSAAELTARIQSWSQAGTGVLHVGCLVTLDGKRLPDAEILFEPETCLAEVLLPATGVTNSQGQCNLTVDPSQLPETLQRVRGVKPGLYKVRITHPIMSIPPKYNTATILGQEVSDGVIGPQGLHFELNSD